MLFTLQQSRRSSSTTFISIRQRATTTRGANKAVVVVEPYIHGCCTCLGSFTHVDLLLSSVRRSFALLFVVVATIYIQFQIQYTRQLITRSTERVNGQWMSWAEKIFRRFSSRTPRNQNKKKLRIEGTTQKVSKQALVPEDHPDAIFTVFRATQALPLKLIPFHKPRGLNKATNLVIFDRRNSRHFHKLISQKIAFVGTETITFHHTFTQRTFCSSGACRMHFKTILNSYNRCFPYFLHLTITLKIVNPNILID